MLHVISNGDGHKTQVCIIMTFIYSTAPVRPRPRPRIRPRIRPRLPPRPGRRPVTLPLPRPKKPGSLKISFLTVTFFIVYGCYQDSEFYESAIPTIHRIFHLFYSSIND